MLESLKPWDPWAFTPDDVDAARLKKELRDECVTRLLPKVERAFTAYLSRPESLRLLCMPQGSLSFRHVLVSQDRLPWGPVIRSALLEILLKANSDSDAYEKANELLELLVEAAGDRPNYIPRKSGESIARDREVVAALWRGVTSKAIQHRKLQHYLWERQALLKLGAQENDLPLTPELARATESLGQTGLPPSKSEGDVGDDSEIVRADGEGSAE